MTGIGGRRKQLPFRTGLLFLAIGAGLLLAWGAVKAEPGMQIAPALPTPTPLPNRPAVKSAPDISSIDSPNPACVLPRAHTGVCYISWTYLYAYANPNYLITTTVEIDGKKRARYNGFFQTDMYIPSEMLVFQVACGAPGSGGDPILGLNHSYTLRARDSSGLGAANYGSVTCPADEPRHIFLPLVRR
jgi:hypothetical protein